MSVTRDDSPDYRKTMGVTQELQRDIIQFLSSKHTANATLTVTEVMTLYKCPADRAERVIANLVKESLLVQIGPGTYKVTL